MMSSPFAHAHFKQCLIGNVKHGDGFDSLTTRPPQAHSVRGG